MINITANGTVEYQGIKDGERWRTTIQPGDIDEARKHLSTEELRQVQAAWTPEVVQAWRDSLPVPNPRPQRGPSERDRIAALEAKIAALEAQLQAPG